jgi:zinc/manganese transport system substrate-binding protein
VHAQVVTTLPEFAWIVQQISPDTKVISLLSGNEDPHFVDASPSFVFKLAKAKVLIKNGMQIEMGWLPVVAQQSGNENVQFGEKGHCDASKDINKIGVIQNYDRSMGDVHPVGNPHYTLSLVEMEKVINTIATCLERNKINVDKTKQTALVKRFQDLYLKLKDKLAPLKERPLLVYHTEFNYLFRDFDLKSIGSLEEVPGVLPSAVYLSKTAKHAMENKAALVLASNVSPQKYLEKFKALSGVNYIKAQIHPLNQDDYLEHYEKFIQELIKKCS